MSAIRKWFEKLKTILRSTLNKLQAMRMGLMDPEKNLLIKPEEEEMDQSNEEKERAEMCVFCYNCHYCSYCHYSLKRPKCYYCGNY